MSAAISLFFAVAAAALVTAITPLVVPPSTITPVRLGDVALVIQVTPILLAPPLTGRGRAVTAVPGELVFPPSLLTMLLNPLSAALRQPFAILCLVVGTRLPLTVLHNTPAPRGRWCDRVRQR
mmetsp:Transcript_7766/g.23273  ORF Transcript_7766/g.23273 Transcript_7766/m.23273 type:complete len:123 (-) Transcript_7766:78-446(-)